MARPKQNAVMEGLAFPATFDAVPSVAQKTEPTLEVTARQRAACELRLKGWSYGAIGDKLGISDVSAHSLVKAALEHNRKKLAESVEDIRRVELDKLDAMDKVLHEYLSKGGGEIVTRENGRGANGPIQKVNRKQAGIQWVLDMLLRVQTARRALLGLDAAQKFEGRFEGALSLETITRIMQEGDNFKIKSQEGEENGPSVPNGILSEG